MPNARAISSAKAALTTTTANTLPSNISGPRRSVVSAIIATPVCASANWSRAAV
jgi:hypothetical protein